MDHSLLDGGGARVPVTLCFQAAGEPIQLLFQWLWGSVGHPLFGVGWLAVSWRVWWIAYGLESFVFLVPRPRPESLSGLVPIWATTTADKPALSGELFR